MNVINYGWPRYGDVGWARFWHLGSSQVLWPPTFFSAFPTVDRVLDLGFLSVSSPWQGKGIATKLAKKAEQLARFSISGFLWPWSSTKVFLFFLLRRLRLLSLFFRDQNCQGMVVIAATTATVKIVERLVLTTWNLSILQAGHVGQVEGVQVGGLLWWEWEAGVWCALCKRRQDAILL